MTRIRIFYKVVLFIIVFCHCGGATLYALATPTHEKINEFIAKGRLNGFELDRYLKKHLGFSKGIYEEVRSKNNNLKPSEGYKVWHWIASGGKWEDLPPKIFKVPYRRSFNHYLNPINNEGYSNWGFYLIPPFIFIFFDQPWNSALEWFLKPLEEQHTGGCYSWHDVRKYFYQALTSVDEAEREDAFANTFRGLGQLMHLIADMSVPAHTRHERRREELWQKIS